MQVWRHTWLRGAALGLMMLLGVSFAQAAQFTATMVTKAGSMEIPGKITVKDDLVRNEVNTGGQTSIHILRPDKQVVWIVLPQQKAYVEMPITQEARQKMMPITEEQKAKMTKVGSETINGYVCDKYESTMQRTRANPSKSLPGWPRIWACPLKSWPPTAPSPSSTRTSRRPMCLTPCSRSPRTTKS